MKQSALVAMLVFKRSCFHNLDTTLLPHKQLLLCYLIELHCVEANLKQLKFVLVAECI